MKATEQYFPVALFTMLFKVVFTFSLCMKSLSVTIQMKATEQQFPVGVFIMLYKVVLTLPWVPEAFHVRFPVSVKFFSRLVSSAFRRVGLWPTKLLVAREKKPLVPRVF